MSSKKRSSLLIRLPLILVIGYLLALVGVTLGTPEANLGLVDGSLKECPPSPNCVSSLAEEFDLDHRVDAFAATPGGLGRLAELVVAGGGAEIVTQDSRYVHATVTTRLMRYVDDIELHQPTPGAPIEVRSASRIGYSDLGANRKRIDALRAAYQSNEGG